MSDQQNQNREEQLPSEDSWIVIDQGKLDEECDRQVTLKMTYGKLLTKQRKTWRRKKNELKVTMAEVDREVRADPASFGIPVNKMPTEKAIENAVLLDPRIKKLVDEEIEEEFWVGIREAEIYALQDRKDMLSKEIDLILSGLYAIPKPSNKTSNKTLYEIKRDREQDEILRPADSKYER